VGQQARCVTAFLLLLAAEWAASGRYECISWEEIIFSHCPVFCDEPLLLIQWAAGDLFCLFILFIVFFKKLLLDEEHLNCAVFLQVIGYLRMAVLVVFLCPLVLNVRDMPRGSSTPNSFIIKLFIQTCTSTCIILIFFSSLSVHLHMQFGKEWCFLP